MAIAISGTICRHHERKNCPNFTCLILLLFVSESLFTHKKTGSYNPNLKT